MVPSSTGFWSLSWDDPIFRGMLTKADNLNKYLIVWDFPDMVFPDLGNPHLAPPHLGIPELEYPVVVKRGYLTAPFHWISV